MDRPKFRAFVLGKMYVVREMVWGDYFSIVTDGGFMSLPDDHAHLMQFTGLLDKNGKEIYEGDIVREGKVGERMWSDKATCTRECLGIVEYHAPTFDIKRIQSGIAKWDDEKEGEWEWTENRYDGVYEGWSDCEVIGNVHDNPELLNARP